MSKEIEPATDREIERYKRVKHFGDGAMDVKKIIARLDLERERAEKAEAELVLWRSRWASLEDLALAAMAYRAKHRKDEDCLFEFNVLMESVDAFSKECQ